MNRLSLATAFIAALVWSPLPLAAQVPVTPSGSAHTRARSNADTMLDVANTRLFVPHGAVAAGSMVGFGVGGVPTADGSLSAPGVVVSVAGGLREPVAVLLTAGRDDRDAPTPALLETASGRRQPCARHATWVACVVERPGAYVLDATDEPAAADPMLDRALASVAATGARQARPLVTGLVVVVAAAVAGGALALLFGRGRNEKDEMPA